MQPTRDKLGSIKNLPPEGIRWKLQEKVSTSGLKKMAKRTFKEFSANLEELIANAYDEDATEVEIIYDEDAKTLSIKDDGDGMNAVQLESYVCYGESKKIKDYKSLKFGRSPIGEFGMGGKLAIFNLCKRCLITTARDGQMHKFSMNSTDLDSAKYLSDVKREVLSTPCSLDLHGTEIFMEDLNYRRILSDSLYERLAMKMPRSLNFRIFLTVKSNGSEERREVEEILPEMERRFEYGQELETIGQVRLEVFYTKDPLPNTKQGIWTKVNGRIVNENQEWFGLDKLTSGNRYRWRLFGYSYADGLKDYINFSKSGFIEGPEYKTYCEFVSECLKKVQNELLKMDETIARQKERELIKNVEKEVNEWVSKLNRPDIQEKLVAQIRKIHTEELEEAPDEPFPDPIELSEIVKGSIDRDRGEDKKERRNRSLAPGRFSYSAKNYRIETVDMSKHGDLVKFTKEQCLIEINEKHLLYENASKENNLICFVRGIVMTQVAKDISEGELVVFDSIYNEIAQIAGSLV